MTPNMARNTPLTVEKINTGRPGLANFTVQLALNLRLEGVQRMRLDEAIWFSQGIGAIIKGSDPLLPLR